MPAARRGGRRRVAIITLVATTAAFGLALGGRAAAEPTPSETSPAPTDPTPTDPTPTDPTPTDPTPTATETSSPTADPSPTESSTPPDPSPTSEAPTTDPSTDATPTPSPTTDPTTTPTPTESSSPTSTGSSAPGAQAGRPPSAAKLSRAQTNARSARERTLAEHEQEQAPAPIGGTYSTASLDVAYRKLVRSGMSRDVATRRIYRPFIVRGPAAWTETWHAPRYAGGYHLHEGQDVFCRYGAPVLAAVAGRVEFDRNTLGGKIARLFMPDGSYWYYAHLSAWSTTVDSGARVDIGEVIGYCGDSGDAVGGPPHVHFGHYLPSGRALDPMSDLVDWLDAAERRVGVSRRPPKEATPPIVVPDYSFELGAEPTVYVETPVSPFSTTSPVDLSAAHHSAGTDVLALTLALVARLMLIPGRRLARRFERSGRHAAR